MPNPLCAILKMILMLALVVSFHDMQSIMVLTEGGPMNATNVMFLYIYQLFFPISAGSTVIQEFGYGAAVSLVAACINNFKISASLITSQWHPL